MPTNIHIFVQKVPFMADDRFSSQKNIFLYDVQEVECMEKYKNYEN
jgi:hypothetical protein